MDFYGDVIDDDFLVEIPCEFCNDLYPLLLLTEHQTGCRPDLVRVIEPTIEELEAQFLELETSANVDRNSTTSSPVETPNPPEPPQQNVLQNVNIATASELLVEEKTLKTTVQKNSKEELPSEENFEILDEDIDQDNKTTFTFGSTEKQKREEEEEKPSFKAPSNPILNIDSKQVFQNQLTESDNEDNESLEDFWKRADIKLSQRLRMIEKKTADRKLND